MNLNRLINMVINTVTRRLINLGINKGIDLATRGGRADPPNGGARKKQAQDARAVAKRARRAARITRRLGR